MHLHKKPLKPKKLMKTPNWTNRSRVIWKNRWRTSHGCTRMAEANLRGLLCCCCSYCHCCLCSCLHGPWRFQSRHWGSHPTTRPFVLGFHCHGRSLSRKLIDFRSLVPFYPYLSYLTIWASGFSHLSSTETYTRLHLPVLLSGSDYACFCCNNYTYHSFEEAVDYYAHLYCCIPSSLCFPIIAVPLGCYIYEYFEVLLESD